MPSRPLIVFDVTRRCCSPRRLADLRAHLSVQERHAPMVLPLIAVFGGPDRGRRYVPFTDIVRRDKMLASHARHQD